MALWLMLLWAIFTELWAIFTERSPMDATERENITKARQSAQLLAQDLRALVESRNVLLADLALELLEPVNKIMCRLDRISY